MKMPLCSHVFQIKDSFKKNAFFITGSGTNVGKTYAAGFIARELVKKGRQVVYMKAIQTGLSQNKPDAEIVRKICPEIIQLDDELTCPYSFMLPASPQLAAKCENRKIHPAKIVRNFDRIRSMYPSATILVEGAGGIMVPIIRTYMMINLISDLNIPVILVALPTLGTINHTLLTMFVLRAKKTQIEGIAFSMSDPNIYEVARDNMLTIKTLTGVRNCGTIPKIT
jgi:dethiobiotin synthetase